MVFDEGGQNEVVNLATWAVYTIRMRWMTIEVCIQAVGVYLRIVNSRPKLQFLEVVGAESVFAVLS